MFWNVICQLPQVVKAQALDDTQWHFDVKEMERNLLQPYLEEQIWQGITIVFVP